MIAEAAGPRILRCAIQKFRLRVTQEYRGTEPSTRFVEGLRDLYAAVSKKATTAKGWIDW